MRKVLLVVVLVGAVFIAGCDFLAFIDDLLNRTVDPGGGGIGGVNFVQIIVEYEFEIDRMYQDSTPGSSPVPMPDTLNAIIASIGPLVFDASTNTYSVETPPGADPHVMMSIQLDPSGSQIRDLEVERRVTIGSGFHERIDHLVAFDIPYDRVEGDSTFYRIDATMPQWLGLGRVDYREWPLSPPYSESYPQYWIDNPSAAQVTFDADPHRYIEIEFRQSMIQI